MTHSTEHWYSTHVIKTHNINLKYISARVQIVFAADVRVGMLLV